MNSIHLALPFLMVFFPILPESMPLSLSPWFKTKLFGVGIISVLCILHSALHKALVMVSTYILICSSLSSISLSPSPFPHPPSGNFFTVSPNIWITVASPKGETPSTNQLVQPHSINIAEWEGPHYTTTTKPSACWALLSRLSKLLQVLIFPIIFHLVFLCFKDLILALQVPLIVKCMYLGLQSENK